MQPSGRFVQDVDRVLRPLQLAQLRRDLDALGFAAGERCGRLPERQITQPKIAQHFDLFAYRRLAGEELHAFLHRHVEHVVDSLSAQRHIQRLAVEPRAFARAAGHFHVGHEVKLRGDHAFSLAFFATAALDVKAEAARLVAARTQLQLGQIYISKGDKEQGRVTLEQALDIFTSIGDRIGMGQCRQTLRDLNT